MVSHLSDLKEITAERRRAFGMGPVALAIVLSFLVASCAAARPAVAPEVRVAHLPPDETDILEALIRSANVPLTVDPFCHDIASTTEDKTIGRYVSGLLATHIRGGQNSIDVNVTEGYPDKKVWIGSVVFSSGEDQSPYVWGLEFRVRRSDGLVFPSSFRCFTLWG